MHAGIGWTILSSQRCSMLCILKLCIFKWDKSVIGPVYLCGHLIKHTFSLQRWIYARDPRDRMRIFEEFIFWCEFFWIFHPFYSFLASLLSAIDDLWTNQTACFNPERERARESERERERGDKAFPQTAEQPQFQRAESRPSSTRRFCSYFPRPLTWQPPLARVPFTVAFSHAVDTHPNASPTDSNPATVSRDWVDFFVRACLTSTAQARLSSRSLNVTFRQRFPWEEIIFPQTPASLSRCLSLTHRGEYVSCFFSFFSHAFFFLCMCLMSLRQKGVVHSLGPVFRDMDLFSSPHTVTWWLLHSRHVKCSFWAPSGSIHTSGGNGAFMDPYGCWILHV